MGRHLIEKKDNIEVYEQTLENSAKVDFCNLQGQTLVSARLELMDHVVLCSITKASLADVDNSEILELLGKIISNEYGTKQIILVEAELVKQVRHFVPVHEKFKRLFHTTPQNLTSTCQSILNKYPNAFHELEQNYQLLVGIDAIVENKDKKQRYRELCYFFENHAKFIETKMQEYKQEDIRGMKLRMRHEQVTSLALVDNKEGKIIATLRSQMADEPISYLSDEIIDASILGLEQFDGVTDEKKQAERYQFCLAYLFQKAIQTVNAQQLLIIAAAEREHFYLNAGWQAFDADTSLKTETDKGKINFVVMLDLAKPGQRFQQLKSEKLKSKSELAQSLKSFGSQQQKSSEQEPSFSISQNVL